MVVWNREERRKGMAGLFQGMMPEAADSGGISGITTGIVKQNWDAEHKGMVKVELIMGESGKNLTGWIPVMSPYAGKEYGQYMLPEIGTEVVVAFNMGNRNCPIVLGCLWNEENPPQNDVLQEKNIRKEWRTKGGNCICLCDESGKESITLTTNGGFMVRLDDEKKTVNIQDKDGKNGIELNAEKGEMTFTASKKMSFQLGSSEVFSIDGSAKQVKLESGKVCIKGSQALEMQGQNTTLKGTMVNLKGDSSFKAESGAMLQVKGAMVKIN